jgi:hypothetical protein
VSSWYKVFFVFEITEVTRCESVGCVVCGGLCRVVQPSCRPGVFGFVYVWCFMVFRFYFVSDVIQMKFTVKRLRAAGKRDN